MEVTRDVTVLITDASLSFRQYIIVIILFAYYDAVRKQETMWKFDYIHFIKSNRLYQNDYLD